VLERLVNLGSLVRRRFPYTLVTFLALSLMRCFCAGIFINVRLFHSKDYNFVAIIPPVAMIHLINERSYVQVVDSKVANKSLRATRFYCAKKSEHNGCNAATTRNATNLQFLTPITSQ
jgi:hypothetical protein